ncbi:MAG: helicase [Phycisphaerae bacterium]|nr:helicase [Phycisphaerae bacterium]|tara:strand:+ start:766 stop:3996 length:3231 start_codon:yes stop_codon:yes gene_type:complete
MLIDNKSHGLVADVLRDSLAPKASLSLLSSRLSLQAFVAMRAEIEQLSDARILIPATTANGTPDESGMHAIGMLGDVADRRSRNSLECPAAAKAFANWLRTTAEVKSVSVPVPQSLFHVQRAGGGLAIQGSSTFTSGGLGLAPSAGYDMNTCFTAEEEARSLLAWFDSIWTNDGATAPCDDLIAAWLSEIATVKPAELVYFLSLYNLFRDTLAELEEDQIIKTRTGIRETLVWNKLYRFQRDGVLGAIDKIEKYNGCIIADSVGLGKTFEALAIIKYYELRNDRVLVLCPKKLRENWTIFTVNDRRNLFASDRFNYDVLNHTDLSRTSGRSGEINLETINWGNYDLVVIDESHNFRNNPPRQDRPTRYSRLMRDIIRSGVRTKVLMLSATPVNSRMNDLKNQVAFITEGEDDALFNLGIPSIEQTLRQAQTRFNAWLKRDADDRTTKSLLDALNFDYFKMLDLLTIARSRKHITKYYNTADIGEFPKRAKPVNIKADIDTRDQFPELREINREIRRLNLSAYAPLKYVLPHKLEEYSRKYDKQISGGSVFRQIDREQSLIHLMRVNLLKRMESSINSFAITLERLLSEVQSFTARLDAHQGEEVEELNIEDVDIDDDDLDPYLIGAKVKVLIQDVDQVRWRQELEEDEELLVKMLREARRIDAERDAKLHELKDLLRRKVEQPLNPGNRKAIIFTAFADTAEYLYKNIAEWAKSDLGVRAALVTGRSDSNKTTLAGIRKDLSSIITSFSPISKERAKIDEALTEEIDFLIATDCISEGQNLQDCDYLVNYDIHWNPVRIIQRFGRIDRLGSQNSVIQLVNFWPNMELDEYINLEARVSGRMVLLDISATGEENVIEQTDADQMNDLEYRRRQFEQMQDEVIDMEDLSNGISITDLTLNDFRMDLVEYLKEHAERLEHMPLGAYGVATTDDLIDIENAGPGVIWCLRAENSRVRTDSTYALSPHYLVYVSDDGEVTLNFSDTKRILDLFKKVSLGCSQPDDAALAIFNERTKNGTNMAHYQGLLGKAIAAITGKAEEHGVQSLFKRGGTAITKDSFQGIDDFEVVAYLAIVDTGGHG